MSAEEPPRGQSDDAGSVLGLEGSDPTAAVVHTLRTVGALDRWSAPDTGSQAAASQGANADFGSLADILDADDDALFTLLSVDAVLDTNALVPQQSLRDFLS